MPMRILATKDCFISMILLSISENASPKEKGGMVVRGYAKIGREITGRVSTLV